MSKIAFCFFGQTRTPSVINKFYKTIENGYDFFISTWDDNCSQELDFNFKDKQLIDFEITSGKIKKNSRNYTIKNDENVKITGNLTLTYASYLINKVLKLKEDYENKNNFKYDLIILCRPDVIVNLESLQECVDKFFTVNYIERPTVSVESSLYINMEKDSKNSSVLIGNDWIFITNSKGADLFGLLYNDIYIEKKDIDIKFPYSNGGHHLFGFLFTYYNFLVFVNSFSSSLIRPHVDEPILELHYKKSYFKLCEFLKQERGKWKKDEKVWEKDNIKVLTGKVWKIIK